MRVRLMQQIDYFAGVPLCFATSLFDKCLSFLTPQRTHDPKKVLFIELSEMGSAILAYSSLKRACDRFGRDNVFFLIFEKNRESVDILDLLPYENVITIPDSSFGEFAIGALKALWEIRSKRIDTCFDLELFSRCTSLLSYLSGASTRVGFDNFTDEGLYRGSFITHRVLLNNHQHISLNFLALLRALDANPSDLPMLKENVSQYLVDLPILSPREEEREKIWKIMKESHAGLELTDHLVVLNPDPGLLALRGWPVERYRNLAQKLLDRSPRIKLVVTGLERSRSFAEALFEGLDPARCIDMCGKTRDLREVVTLFSFCKVLVTNDSGPAHLASLADIGCIVLFGPESPEKYGPLGKKVTSLYANLSCSPCYSPANHRYSICTNNECLKAISLDAVFRATITHLPLA